MIAKTQSRAGNKEFGFQYPAQFDSFKANVEEFLNNGGKYIAVGGGASLATKTLGLTDDDIVVAGYSSNGIAKVDYSGEGVTGGYGEDDLGFVYRPVWYENTDNDEVSATFDDNSDFFVAGHWKNNSEAQGKAVIVKEQDKDVTMIGLEAGFRDHTDYLFRLLSNSIFEK
ncbi:hypothetical protein [Mesobacillus boroniphilus]|uniref:Alkaline phosphatase isozyme conversion protein n=1 Tax=Mesobacillus boroniphilus JCM 21738 TaxID=1294265 RepID=W4RLS5_9BACI|nr:hypothetical protein [Mesobacillus boroniphilus]GAE45072.1 alkaline phosphatase isozyme conversion protein precursor [Mesobacillus boroniphilus JCM 21738]